MGEVLLTIAGHHIVPCLLACVVVFGALGLVFGPIRVRRPRDRVLFLYAAFVKALLALWVGSGISCLVGYPQVTGHFGIRWPNISPDNTAFLEASSLITPLVESGLSGRVALAVLALGVVVVVYRWVRLAPLFGRVQRAEERPDGLMAAPERLLQRLLEKSRWGARWQRTPQLLSVAPGSLPVMTMGLRSPVIVLPVDLVAELGERELEGLLAHELGHIRRLDYLGRWAAAILRDVMVWNPFAHAWFARLVREQEMAADEWAGELLDDPQAVASALVEATAHAEHLPVLSLGPLGAWGRRRARRELDQRVDALANNSTTTASRPQWLNFARWALLAVFFTAQPHIAVSFPKLPRLLGQG
jgi:beta-lactamase regulating signal transducer with metallopeptidase domain